MTTVTGTYLGPDDAPAEGRVTFSLTPPARDLDGAQRTTGPVVALLDPSGTFTAELVPDPELVVDGQAQYLVTEQVSGLVRSWLLLVDGTPVDLPSRYPGDGTQPGAVVPVPGPTGPPPVLVDGTTTTGAPGTAADLTVVPVAPEGTYRVDAQIPRGDKGDKGDQGDQGVQGEVSVASTVTGAPGTSAAVTDSDPSPNRAVLTFTVPRGDVGPTGPAIGGLLTTKGDLVARDATAAVRVPVGTTGQALLADPAAAPGVAWRTLPVGNLLTDNQASGTDTLGTTAGFTGNGGTYSSDAAQFVQGARSLKLTNDATVAQRFTYFGYGTTNASTTSGGIPVVEGQTYTASAWVRAPAINYAARIYWYQANGTTSAGAVSVGGTVLCDPAAWKPVIVTGTAPAGAAFAGISMTSTSANFPANDVAYFDKMGFWQGIGGDWAMPGVPITATAMPWGTVAALADLPASGNWLGRRIQVTGGLGLQVMVWTGAAWVVDPVSDTGWQTVAPLNAWTATTCQLRRTGYRVTHILKGTSPNPANAVYYVQQSGWRRSTINVCEGTAMGGASLATVYGMTGVTANYNMDVLPTPPVSVPVQGSSAWTTADAWPTAAPT